MIQTQVQSSRLMYEAVVLVVFPQEELRAHPGAVAAAQHQVARGARQMAMAVARQHGRVAAVAGHLPGLPAARLLVMEVVFQHALLRGRQAARLLMVVKHRMVERLVMVVVPRMAAEQAMVAAHPTAEG